MTKPSLRSLPVLSLLFTATLWGIVWYPLRLLEARGLVCVRLGVFHRTPVIEG
jgi:hypothetical protein